MKTDPFSARILRLELVPWEELRILQPGDFKALDDESRLKLRASLLDNKFTEPFYVWQEISEQHPGGRAIWLLDGKHRLDVLRELLAEGHAIPPLLPALFISCSGRDEAAELILQYSSQYAKITETGFGEFLKSFALSTDRISHKIDLPSIDLLQFGNKLSGTKPDPTDTRRRSLDRLSERFIVPPFSVIDGRSGDWKARRREWSSLGLKEGAKFDPVLAEVVYHWYSPRPDVAILDPFSGNSVRGIVASVMGRNYTGIDIEPLLPNAQVAAWEKIPSIPDRDRRPVFLEGDSTQLDKILESVATELAPVGKFDLLFTAPPAFDNEPETQTLGDLSSLSWDEFRSELGIVISKAAQLLNENRFAVVIAEEVRDKKSGFVRNFEGAITDSFAAAGMQLYDRLVILQAIGTVAMRAGKQFSSQRRAGNVHRSALVFFKGDVKKIKTEFPAMKAVDKAAGTE